jgi:hypothetical protein
MAAKKLSRHFLSLKKNVIHTLLSYDYRLDYNWYFLGGKFRNLKLFCHFLL